MNNLKKSPQLADLALHNLHLNNLKVTCYTSNLRFAELSNLCRSFVANS